MSELNTTNTEIASEGEHTQEMSQEMAQESQAKPAEEVVETEVEAKKEESESKEESAEQKQEEPKDRFAPKFAALSRKEKAIKQREAELETKMRSFEEQASKSQERQRLKRENPLKFLEEEGLTYEDLTKAVLNNGELTPEQKQQNVMASLQDKIKGLEEKLSTYESKLEEKETEAVQKRYAERIDNFKKEIRSTVSSDEKYELIQTYDAFEDIYEVIEGYYNEHKRVLDIKEAADMVEQELEEQASKLAKTKKISAKFAPAKPEPKPENKAQSDSPKTLENAHSSQSPDRQARKLSDDEITAQAASLIRWTE